MADDDKGQPTSEGVAPTPAPVDGPILTDQQRLGALDGEYDTEGDPNVPSATTPGAEPAVTDTTPLADAQPTGSSMEEMQAKIDELSGNLATIEKRYGDSSTEGKRLAEELRSKDQLLGKLRDTYGLDELESFEPTVDPQSQPVTRAELDAMRIEQDWKTGKVDFQRENPEFRDPTAFALINDALFREGGVVDYNKSPSENLEAAKAEALKFMQGLKDIGKQEMAGVRQEITEAAITDASTPAPEPTLTDEDEAGPPEGEDYVEWRRKTQAKIRGEE